jgi:alcohol dehydrogenase class IV
MEAEELTAILKKHAPRTKDVSDLKIAFIRDKTPLAERNRIIKELASRVRLAVFDQVEPNPRTADIMAMFSGGDFSGSDMVIGMGGGSVLDSAKALAMLAANGGSLDEYLGASPSKKISNPSLPLVLIPTTAGTGSEVTKVGVYTSAEGRKYTLGSPLMMARAAVLSGSVLDAVPPALCAATGFDALDHALESIWNKNATKETRAIAEEAAVEVLTWLPESYAHAVSVKNGGAPAASSAGSGMKMLRASCMAGTAFNSTGTAAGHAISFVLSEDWHVPHGSACAFTLLDIFDLSVSDENTAGSLARISAAFHPQIKIEDRDELIKALRNKIAALMKETRIPERFIDIGVNISPAEIDARFSRAFTDPKMLNQIPPATKENIYPILERKC